MSDLCIARLLLVALMLVAELSPAQTILTRGESMSVDVSAERQEILFTLLGDLWTVPVSTGVAQRLAESVVPAHRSRWSPDSTQIAFETRRAEQSEIWLLDVDSSQQRQIMTSGRSSAQPAWHPSGERLVYASRADGGSFDIWETDLATGLEWRLTSSAGDDLEPAWSADGRHLVYINHQRDQWRLMLRRFGESPQTLATSESPLQSPSWRPDGTLLTFFAEMDGRTELRMLILSDPPLERRYSSEETLFPTPVSWLDRERMYYSVGDRIMTRDFDDWAGRIVPFRASVAPDTTRDTFTAADRELPLTTPAPGRLVVRAGRLFDGLSRNYRDGADVLIDNGVIADITASRDWPGIPVIELPSTTLVPGYIDVYAQLPQTDMDSLGASLLAWGVTTIVAQRPTSFDPAIWEAEDTPGPRLLSAEPLSPKQTQEETEASGWPFLVIAGESANEHFSNRTEQKAASDNWLAAGVPVLATHWPLAATLETPLLIATDTATPAPSRNLGTNRGSGGSQRFDLASHRLISGLASRQTVGIERLFESRQASELSVEMLPRTKRVPLVGDLRRSRLPMTAGSGPNGFPPGLALHAELLALQEARLEGDQILGAVGRQAASVLGLSGELGQITVGARADLVLLDGDPLTDPNDLRNIVAVIRNGRFYSLVSLLDRLQRGVE